MQRTTRAPGRPKAAENLDTRDALMRVGLMLFASKGYSAVSVGEIVEAAGVSVSVVYQRFGSKAGLFVEVTKDCYRRGLDLLRPMMAGIDNLDDAIACVIEGFGNMYRLDRELPGMVFSALAEVNRHEELADELRGTMREFRAYFDDIAALAPASLTPTSQDRRDLSRALIAICSGLTTAAVMTPNPEDYQRMLQICEALFRGRIAALDRP